MKYDPIRHATLVFVAFAALVLSGCVTSVAVAPVETNDRFERVYDKSYTVGKEQTVNVGSPIIAVADYWKRTSQRLTAVPERSVTLAGGIVRIELLAGTQYPIKGALDYAGESCAVVATNNDPIDYRGVLIRGDGSLTNRTVTPNPFKPGTFIFVAYELQISDPSVRLRRERSESSDTSRGYERFELIYSGINGNSLNITYREFTPDGLARSAFFQNLTYPADAKSITFREFKISVLSADAESIRFVVSQDGR